MVSSSDLPPIVTSTARDPQWLAHRYDPSHDAVHFINLPRDEHRAATFLIDEHLPPGREPVVLRRQDAVAARPATAPIHFLFHSGYCCSTLLARAVDRPGWAMGLKEPVILNDLIGWRRRGGKGPDMASVLDDALTLMARPFGPGEAVVVKPSTAANALAPAILTLRPDARAILMYAPLRAYLASIAKKGIDGRLWVRTLLTGMMEDNLLRFGFTARDHVMHTDLQVAAIGWLAQQQLYASLIAMHGAERVRTLDSTHLMADPATAMRALSALFGQPLTDNDIAAVVSGPAFTRHSKSGGSFGAADRAAEHEAATQAHAAEIDAVANWTSALAKSAGIALDAPAPLLG